MPPGSPMLLLVLLAVGLLTGVVIVTIMAFSLLRPPRMTDGKALWVLRRLSPGDLKLRFENVSYFVRDERDGTRLRIAGWWIPNPNANGRCVVLLHGYADAKVGAIAWAPVCHEMGFNILAIDLRAHGESEGSYSTAGYWERHDVSQVINELRAQRPTETQHLILFGVSLGAAVAAATAALRDDVAAVVLDSPYADFNHAAMANMERLRAPGRLFQNMALALAQRIARADFSISRTADLIAAIRCPVMVVLPAEDVLMTSTTREQIEQIVRKRIEGGMRDEIWVVPGVGHLAPIIEMPGEYAERIKRFVVLTGGNIAEKLHASSSGTLT